MSSSISKRAAYVYDDSLSRHVLREGHPMRPVRLQYTSALLRGYAAFDDPGALVVNPRPATREELLTFHTEFYLEIVERLSNGEEIREAELFGFSEAGDNPVYEGMYEAMLLSTGASVQAAELIADGVVSRAFAPAGGLHHATSGRASGFCIFNDPVVAINALRKRGLRVCYVDIDAHHGDGVQNAFYRDADVMTISVHEGPRWLFPGTGEVNEIGEGNGKGFSVNLPLFPYTPDDVFISAFDEALVPLIKAFKPDVLATQLGADAYIRDPLTQLGMTTQGYETLVEGFDALGYPWLAFGGGGYDLDAVPRCWALAYGIMLGRRWPDALPPGAEAFLESDALRDKVVAVEDDVLNQTSAWADKKIQEIKRLIFPLHGLAS
jgi:acetoin utilization protein AcuC